MVEKLTIRSEPCDFDGIVRLVDWVYAGKYPAPELRSAAALRLHVGVGAETYFAALRDDVVVGCVSTRVIGATVDRATGEHVAELGRLCTSPALPNRAVVAGELCRAALEYSAAQGARCWYATLRSGPSIRIAQTLGFLPVGYTEEHVVGNDRERHVVALRTTPALLARRVVPPNRGGTESVYGDSFVRKVNGGLGLHHASVAAYPSMEFVGDPDAPREVVRFQSNSPERRIRLLSPPLVAETYADAIILSDKSHRIAMLRRQGFRLTAFLPAWYELKFDCVVLAKGFDHATAADSMLLRCLRQFDELTEIALSDRASYGPTTEEACRG